MINNFKSIGTFLILSVSRIILASESTLDFDVAIIGAGAAGISHAYYLKQENPELRIAVFEKDSHIGGKCFSYIDNQGKAHDMGALLEATNYRAIKELVDIAGISKRQSNSNA